MSMIELPDISGSFTQGEIRSQFRERVVVPFKERYGKFADCFYLNHCFYGRTVAEGAIYEIDDVGYERYPYATFSFKVKGGGSFIRNENPKDQESFSGSWEKVMKAVLSFISVELGASRRAQEQLDLVANLVKKGPEPNL